MTNPYRFTAARLLREAKILASINNDTKIITRIGDYMLHRSKKIPAQFRETLIEYVIDNTEIKNKLCTK